MNAVQKFRRMIANNEVVVAPGIYDCVSAKIAEQTGFPAVYMSGFGTNASIYGKPDIGLVTGTEMIAHARNIVASVEVPVLADADTGYGNAINVRRTVQEYERAGVAGIHLEDQDFPKKCGNMSGRNIIPAQEMVVKIKAAVDARVNPDFVIIARSDASSEHGAAELIERGQAYIEAGADAFFPTICDTPNIKEEMRKIGRAFNVPLMFTLTHYGAISFITVEEAVEMGFRLLVSPWGALAFASHAVAEFMKGLKETGSLKGFADRMIPFNDFTGILGLPEIKAMEARYGVKQPDDCHNKEK